MSFPHFQHTNTSMRLSFWSESFKKLHPFMHVIIHYLRFDIDKIPTSFAFDYLFYLIPGFNDGNLFHIVFSIIFITPAYADDPYIQSHSITSPGIEVSKDFVICPIFIYLKIIYRPHEVAVFRNKLF